MGDKTGIEWTDATWNALRGCSRVSEGCRNCYAERTAARFAGPNQPYEGFVRGSGASARWSGWVDLIDAKLDEPRRWTRPRRIFVNSMSDLFHPDALRSPYNRAKEVDSRDSPAGRIFDVMIYRARQHTYQVLTKRPEAIKPFLEDRADGYCLTADTYDERLPEMMQAGDFDHIWFGTSVENRAALPRIDDLRRTPGINRFLSVEPLLEDLGEIDLTGIGWVIVGGESGPGARPMHPDWARSLRDQCGTASVPFFFKQWGEWAPGECATSTLGRRFVQTADWFNDEWFFEEVRGDFEGHIDDEPALYRVGKKAALRTLDGRTWDEMPGAAA